MNKNLISFDNVSVAYKGRMVLHNLTMTTNKGEFSGIIGPNGAGKSTLLMSLIGFRKIAGGSANVLNNDIRTLDEKRWATVRKRIGYLPQKPIVDPFFPVTVEEVVLMGRVGYAGLLRSFTHNDRENTEYWLHTLGLQCLRRKPLGQLSGGEQQKVHLARILNQEPEIILFDEPMSGLDLKWQQILGELIEDIARKGQKGIIMVTHELHHLPPSCDTIRLLHQGEIFFTGFRAALTDRLLSDVYGCRIEKFMQNGRMYISPWGAHV